MISDLSGLTCLKTHGADGEEGHVAPIQYRSGGVRDYYRSIGGKKRILTIRLSPIGKTDLQTDVCPIGI